MLRVSEGLNQRRSHNQIHTDIAGVQCAEQVVSMRVVANDAEHRNLPDAEIHEVICDRSAGAGRGFETHNAYARDSSLAAKRAIAYAYTNDTLHHMKGGHPVAPPLGREAPD